MSRPPRLATGLLSGLVPARDREELIGDLVEEHALRARGGGDGAARWYWGQTLRTLASLAWAGFRRGGWLKTLGAVLLAFLVVNAIVMAGDVAMAVLPGAGQQTYAVLSLAVGAPAAVLGGYLAARLRRGAAGGLAVLTAAMAVSLLATGDAAPRWYQLALIVVGPAGALLGGRLRARRAAGAEGGA